MRQAASLPYFRSQDVEVLVLPHGSGGVRMVLVLPEPGTESREWLSTVNDDIWRGWLIALIPSLGFVLIPKLKLAFGMNLISPPTELGLGVVIDSARADF